MNRESRAPSALLLVLLAGLLSGSVAASELVWTDDDWSAGHNAGAQGVDPDIQPGILTLENRMDDFRYLAQTAPWQGYWSMTVYHDSLFIAASDYPYDYDGAQVLTYDYVTNTVNVEYEPYESGLHLIKTMGDTIYVPGPDSMDPWTTPGSIYLYDGHEWIEKATLPTAVHVNDVDIFGGRLYATTAHAQGELDGLGCVWMSEDHGDTFTRVLSLHPTSEDLFRRFFSLGHIGNTLFAQPDGNPPESNCVYATHDGINWTTYPVLNLPPESMANFVTWGADADTLLMAIVNRLYIWANGAWQPRSMPFNLTRWGRGLQVYKDRLYGGGLDDRIYRWLHGSQWEYVTTLPVNTDSLHVGAMATHYGRVFVSAWNSNQGFPGKLFVSASQPIGHLFSLPHDFGTSTMNGALSWDDVRPGEGNLAAFQLRSGATLAEMATSPFIGPDGTSASYYEQSGVPIANCHRGDRFFQYRVELRCPAGTWMPFLRSMTLGLDSLDIGGVADQPSMPSAPVLGVSAANPTHGMATLRFALENATDSSIATGTLVHVRICDLLGRRVRSASIPLSGGECEWRWDLRDDGGRRVAAGVYRVAASVKADGSGATIRSIVVI